MAGPPQGQRSPQNNSLLFVVPDGTFPVHISQPRLGLFILPVQPPVSGQYAGKSADLCAHRPAGSYTQMLGHLALGHSRKAHQ